MHVVPGNVSGSTTFYLLLRKELRNALSLSTAQQSQKWEAESRGVIEYVYVAESSVWELICERGWRRHSPI